jgi:hypothetical protein
MTRGIPNKTPVTAQPERRIEVIDWPIDASPEWIDQTFGAERVKSFCQQLAEIEYEYQMRQLAANEVHAPTP